jgi:acylphosphatase
MPLGRRQHPAPSPPPDASPDAGRVRAHLWLSGRVQGVGFRVYARREAAALGLTGFVRNLPDRRVEIVVEGPGGGVEAFIRAMRVGPEGAMVRGVALAWEAPAGEAEFVIRTDGAVHE